MPPDSNEPPLADAIILAGGRGSRMGGIDKPAIVIGGQSLLEIALAASAGCARSVVVGPPRPDLPAQVLQAQEAPVGAGPVAGIGAGLSALGPGAEFVITLAADLPFLTPAAVAAVLDACARSAGGAAFAHDGAGRPQYLIAAWRRTTLQSALAQLPTLANQPMKAIVPANAALTPLAGTTDVDTNDDVQQAIWSSCGPGLTVAQARETVRSALRPTPAIARPLRPNRGATLAGPVHAGGALPRADVAAMDGYAVAGPGPWRVREDTGFAGGARPDGLHAGDAVRIATGAHLPEGADTVLRDEFVELKADQLHRIPGSPARDDVRRQGSEFAPGAIVAGAGTAVTPALISAALSVEVTAASMRGPLRAQVVMTGDEIRSTGPLHAGQTRDSIGPVIAEYLQHNSIRLHGLAHLRDTGSGFSELLSVGTAADLLVVVGATGGGAADHLRVALAQARATILVGRLAMKPGGSALVAQIPGGPVVFGVPGNPFAAITALSVLAPVLVDALTGRAPAAPVTGMLVNASQVSGPVTRAVAARPGPEGRWHAETRTRTAHLAGLIGVPALALVPPHAADGDLAELLFLPS